MRWPGGKQNPQIATRLACGPTRARANFAIPLPGQMHDHGHACERGRIELGCRQIVFELYFAGHCLGEICDEVLAHAFHEIGDR